MVRLVPDDVSSHPCYAGSVPTLPPEWNELFTADEREQAARLDTARVAEVADILSSISPPALAFMLAAELVLLELQTGGEANAIEQACRASNLFAKLRSEL